MRQIGMAIVNHETRFQRFPPAATAAPAPEQSVMVYLLPFFDEAGLFAKIDRGEDWDVGSNRDWERHFNVGGLFYCPSSPSIGSRRRWDGSNYVLASERSTGAPEYETTDYAPAQSINPTSTGASRRYLLSNGGDFVVQPLGEINPPIDTAVRGPYSSANQKWAGLLQLSTSEKGGVRANAVRDGLSTTMMFFEVAGRPEHFVDGKLPRANQSGYDNPTSINSFRWAGTALPISINKFCRRKEMINCENSDEISAFHDDGAFVVFADASVHFLRQSIDPETFVSLYTIAGGDVVSEQEIGF
jgi:hypothetical protein